MEFQKLDDGLRRGGDKARPPVGEQPHVERIHALDVLGRNDVVDDVALIERPGERRQQEDPVDPWIHAQPLERRHQLSLGRIAGQGDFVDRNVELLSVGRETLQIGARGWIDPDGDDREARSDSSGRECGAPLARPLMQFLREWLAIKEPHGATARSGIRRSP